MVTYEEFLKENGIQNLKRLTFGKEKMIIEDALIDGNPRDYLDIARNAKELEYIRVEGTENKDFYEAFTEFVRNCSEKVKIRNRLIGSANKTEYFKGEEKIKEIINRSEFRMDNYTKIGMGTL